MEHWYNVKETAEIMRCGVDTARARMQQMPDVVNAGTEGRRILLVPEGNIEDWFRNRRMTRPGALLPGIGKNKKIPRCSNGKIARIDRRTGKLKAV